MQVDENDRPVERVAIAYFHANEHDCVEDGENLAKLLVSELIGLGFTLPIASVTWLQNRDFVVRWHEPPGEYTGLNGYDMQAYVRFDDLANENVIFDISKH